MSSLFFFFIVVLRVAIVFVGVLLSHIDRVWVRIFRFGFFFRMC